MLQKLTDVSVERLGELPEAGFDEAVAGLGLTVVRRMVVTDKTVTRLFRNEGSATVLDIVDGTAILFAGERPDALETFLLDRTVVLRRGIFYYITPLIHTAGIAVGYDGLPAVVPIEPHERPAGMTPQIQPSRVHTLFYQEKDGQFVFKGESHPFWELTYVDSGRLLNRIDGTDHTLRPGQMMLCLPDRFHSQAASGGAPVRYLTVTFDMAFAEPEILDGIVFDADDYLKNLLSAIVTESRENKIYADDLVLCYLKELIIALIRIRRIERYLRIAHPAVRRTMENKIAAQANEYIDAHLDQPLTVRDIARSIPVSESYLSTIYRQSTGRPLIRAIREAKLTRAKELIASGAHTVTDIAEMLGYGSVHYFSAQFKKEFGVTPTRFAGTILR